MFVPRYFRNATEFYFVENSLHKNQMAIRDIWRTQAICHWGKKSGSNFLANTTKINYSHSYRKEICDSHALGKNTLTASKKKPFMTPDI